MHNFTYAAMCPNSSKQWYIFIYLDLEIYIYGTYDCKEISISTFNGIKNLFRFGIQI